MISQIKKRENNRDLPSYPQPFYANSIGLKRLDENHLDYNPGINNPFIELTWGIEGTGEINFYGRKYEMKPNDVFYFLPGEDHSMRAVSKQWTSRWLCFDGPLAVANFMAYRFPRHQHCRHECPGELFEDIAAHIAENDIFQNARIAGCVITILAYLTDSNYSGRDGGGLFEKMDEFLRANYSDPGMGIKKLCDVFGISRGTLNSLFRRNVNHGPGTHLTKIRLKNALQLLRGTDLPVSAVASRCGYNGHIAFSRMFHRETGKLPSDFRMSR